MAALVLLLMLALAACSSDPDAEGADDDGDEDTSEDMDDDGDDGDDMAAGGLDEVCAQAEGTEFRYQTNMPAETFDELAAPWRERYPGIDVDYLATNPEEVVQRVLTAHQAGQDDVGVDLAAGSVAPLWPLVENDLVDMEIDWTTVGIPEELITEASNTVRIYRVAQGLGYNSDTTDPADLPDTWEELIDEQYEGQVITHARGLPFYVLSLALGEEETIDYIERFIEVVDPLVQEGSTGAMVDVVNGEALMTVSARSDSRGQLQDDGAPIEIKYLDYVPVDEQNHVLFANSPNRDAAVCFAGWLATDEGSEAFAALEHKTNDERPEGVPDDAEIVGIQDGDDAAFAQEMGVTISNMLTGQQ